LLEKSLFLFFMKLKIKFYESYVDEGLNGAFSSLFSRKNLAQGQTV